MPNAAKASPAVQELLHLHTYRQPQHQCTKDLPLITLYRHGKLGGGGWRGPGVHREHTYTYTTSEIFMRFRMRKKEC